MNSQQPGNPTTPHLPARRGVLLGAASAAVLLAGCAGPDDSLAAQELHRRRRFRLRVRRRNQGTGGRPHRNPL